MYWDAQKHPRGSFKDFGESFHHDSQFHSVQERSHLESRINGQFSPMGAWFQHGRPCKSKGKRFASDVPGGNHMHPQ